MSGALRHSRSLRVATAILAIASIAMTLDRSVPELGAARIIAGGVTLALAVGAVIALLRVNKRRKLARRRIRITDGCKLCGLDPAVDDADEAAPRGRCIECGRVRRS